MGAILKYRVATFRPVCIDCNCTATARIRGTLVGNCMRSNSGLDHACTGDWSTQWNGLQDSLGSHGYKYMKKAKKKKKKKWYLKMS